MSLLIACLLLSAPLAAQAPPVASDPSLNDLLMRLRATAEKTDADLARLRIDKWKADGNTKRDSQASADAIHRNLVNAVPDLIQSVQAAPGSLLANFRLYRNLVVLYEAYASLTESTGAFGPTSEYRALGSNLAEFDHERQQLAQRLDLLAGASDAELARLRSRPGAATGKAPAASNKKVVVDDAQPAPKKRKSAPPSSQP